jgi:hypothetical protein
MIEQIKDILKNIENSASETERINYSLEVCKLVFENTRLDEIQYENLKDEDMIIDSVLSVDEIVKSISIFLTNSLKYLDKDLKGSDFEIEIQENIQKLEVLQIKYTSSIQKYQELKKSQQEIEKIQSEMNEIQVKIDEYEEIDLEKVQREGDEKFKKLAELKKTESRNLKIYQRHMEENKKITIINTKLTDLSNGIKKNLTRLDELVKNSLNGFKNV